MSVQDWIDLGLIVVKTGEVLTVQWNKLTTEVLPLESNDDNIGMISIQPIESKQRKAED